MCPFFWDLLTCRWVIGARHVKKRFSHIAKIELPKRTLDISILEDKAFSRNVGHQSPVNEGPYPKRTETALLKKSLKPAKLMSLKLLHRIRQGRVELKT